MMDGPSKIAAWAAFLKQLRAFFDGRGFVEVQTDHLVPAGAFEGTIDPLQVRWSAGAAELHTSPEIEMKRLLAHHRVSIYQICRCFRDDPETPVHRREFTMLECYRVGADYRAIIADLRELFETLSGKALPWEEHTVSALVLRHTGIDIAEAATAEPLRAAIERRGTLHLAADDSWADMFFRLLIEKVEPALPADRPVIVTDYPVALSPLSKAAAAGHTAERFEIYWRGMELCNGCTELADATELRRRYRAESATRQLAGKLPHSPPDRLLEALENGFPPSAGVAIGLERLFLCLEIANGTPPGRSESGARGSSPHPRDAGLASPTPE
jgi:elongation factor P--(R)-beta-lysine ligase